MKLIRVAAGVLNQTPLDWDRNYANIAEAIEQARSNQVGVLCLPEMCITGYGCEDAFYSNGVLETAIEILDDIRQLTDGIIPVCYCSQLVTKATEIRSNPSDATLVEDALTACATVREEGDKLLKQSRWIEYEAMGRLAVGWSWQLEAEIRAIRR